MQIQEHRYPAVLHRRGHSFHKGYIYSDLSPETGNSDPVLSVLSYSGTGHFQPPDDVPVPAEHILRSLHRWYSHGSVRQKQFHDEFSVFSDTSGIGMDHHAVSRLFRTGCKHLSSVIFHGTQTTGTKCGKLGVVTQCRDIVPAFRITDRTFFSSVNSTFLPSMII